MNPDRQETRAQRRERERREAKRKARQEPSILSHILTRRNLLIGAGGLGITAASLGLFNVITREKEIWEDKDFRNLPTNADLLQTFDDLPESAIKDLLQQRIKPLFTENYPRIIQIGSATIPVEPAPAYKVVEEQRGNMMGKAGFLQEGVRYVSLAESVNRKLPYKNMLLPGEQSSITTFLPDGTPYLPIIDNAPTTMLEGIAPVIEITFPTLKERSALPPTLNRQQAQYTHWLMMKEAASLLMIDLTMNHFASEMAAIGESTQVKAIDPEGNIRDVSILPQLIYGVALAQGRLWNSIDKAGAVLASKAVQIKPDVLPSFLQNDTLLKPSAKNLADIRLGTSPNEIYTTTMQWCALDRRSTLLENAGLKGNRSVFP